jgi:hypothetical protein
MPVFAADVLTPPPHARRYRRRGSIGRMCCSGAGSTLRLRGTRASPPRAPLYPPLPHHERCPAPAPPRRDAHPHETSAQHVGLIDELLPADRQTDTSTCVRDTCVRVCACVGSPLLGLEACGLVVAMGAKVQGVELGDVRAHASTRCCRAAEEPESQQRHARSFCFSCKSCRRNWHN